MRKIVLFISIVSILSSCSKDILKEHVKLSGKIENATVKEMKLKSRNGYSKIITISDTGVFSDTLQIGSKGEVLTFSNGKTGVLLYVKNGDDINITFDSENIDETIKFSGEGAANNNYFVEKKILSNKLFTRNLLELKEADFNTKLKEFSTKFTELLSQSKGLDKNLIKLEKEGLKNAKKQMRKQYKSMNATARKPASLKGKPSPNFENYENHKGGTTSLKDLRGKYVYIDVWATWCRPCLGEIPHLQKLEETFKNSNIHFVSISIDKEKAKGKWRKMIVDKKMGGIQLFAKQGDSFAKAYNINSIPRFILLDPKGNVINEKASRPSSPSTKDLLTSLLK